jgi:hypothetical protein
MRDAHRTEHCPIGRNSVPNRADDRNSEGEDAGRHAS